MRSSSRAETARLGVLVAFAMLLSYIEILLPLNIPALPGFKLGLANTVSAAAAVYMGLYAAFAVNKKNNLVGFFCSNTRLVKN